MDTYECNHCGNTWPDYDPKACPFCFSQEIRLVGTEEVEPIVVFEDDKSDTESTWTQN